MILAATQKLFQSGVTVRICVSSPYIHGQTEPKLGRTRWTSVMSSTFCNIFPLFVPLPYMSAVYSLYQRQQLLFSTRISPSISPTLVRPYHKNQPLDIFALLLAYNGHSVHYRQVYNVLYDSGKRKLCPQTERILHDRDRLVEMVSCRSSNKALG